MAKLKKTIDDQRKQVYDWEDDLIRKDPSYDARFENLKAVQEFVNKVLADHGLSWAPKDEPLDGRTFHAKDKELVRWKRGGSKRDVGGFCAYMGHEDSLRDGRHPMRQWMSVSSQRWIVIHETAHLLCDQLHDVHDAGHGATFVRTYIELLSIYFEPFKGRFTWLEKHARKAGLAVSRRSVLSPHWKTRPGEAGRASTCVERPSDVVRRVARANPDAKFSEKVRLCVAEGVNPTTAEGVLVRFMRNGK